MTEQLNKTPIETCLAGQVAAAASPAVANQIGQYFKGLAADNENGQLSAGQETAHVLAHGMRT